MFRIQSTLAVSAPAPGQIVGNLVELKVITIHSLPYIDDDIDDDDEYRPDWEVLTRILPYLRRKFTLSSSVQGCYAEVEAIQGLARAIHGNPMISEFRSEGSFTFASMGPWCAALATLPSLELVVFSHQEPETEEDLVLLNLEPLKELLRTPALRFAVFSDFCFTNELCHAMANALEEGSSITDIIFEFDCSFPDGGSALIANALQRNTSVTDFKFVGDVDEPLYNTLAAILLCNSTLQKLSVGATCQK
jgi:hypothetical protein